MCSTLIIKIIYTQCMQEMYKDNLNARVKFVRNLALSTKIITILPLLCLLLSNRVEKNWNLDIFTIILFSALSNCMLKCFRILNVLTEFGHPFQKLKLLRYLLL